MRPLGAEGSFQKSVTSRTVVSFSCCWPVLLMVSANTVLFILNVEGSERLARGSNEENGLVVVVGGVGSGVRA